MKRFTGLSLFLLSLALVGEIRASISVELQFGAFDAPPGSLGVIVADTGANGFESPSSLTGVPLSPGSVLGTDDVILAAFSNSNLPEWASRRGFAQHFAEIDYEALGIEEGQPLLLYVFPDRAAGDPVRTGEPHVAYRTDDASQLTDNSSMGYTLPADGGAYLLAALDPTTGGTADLSTVDIAAADLDEGEGDLERDLALTGRHTYFFEMTQDGFLSISGTGMDGLRGELYHRDGQLIATSDGSLPFFFEEDLEAGFHMLVLYREDSNPADQAYEIEFASDYVRFVSPDVAVGSSFANLRGGGQVFAPGAEVALISKKARRVTGVATIANLGDRPEALAVRAARGNRSFRSLYRGPEGNITGGLVTGTYRTPVLAAGSPLQWVRAEFTPNKRQILLKLEDRTLVKRKAYASLLYANSSSNPALYDGGWWRVRTR